MRMPILTNPNEELRVRAEDYTIDEITTTESQAFFDNLIETMAKAEGVGIAGPQVGVHKRVFVGLKDGAPFIFINPKIVKTSHRKLDSEEGCLSIPGVWGIVKRHKWIEMTYIDRDGNEQRERLNDFEGIVAQHENDHLDGVLFIDRVVRYTTTPTTL